MAKWIIKLITVGFAMTFILRLLPDNSIKKAAQMAFGIVFLIVAVAPVGKLFNDGYSSQNIIDFFENQLSYLPEGDYDQDYIADVIDTYCANLETAVENKIVDETGAKCEILVDVYDDINSNDFGKVMKVSCRIISGASEASADETKDNTVDGGIISDIPLVNDIVISLDGIIQGDNKSDSDINDESNDGGVSLQKKQILTVICNMLGIDGNMCVFEA